MDVGDRVHSLRVARGWSQDELARRVTASGVHLAQTSISNIEATSGRRRRVRAEELPALAAVFRVSISQLIGTPGSSQHPRAKSRRRLITVEVPA